MAALTLQELIEKIQSGDPQVRTEAWLAAGQVGPGALEPLARLAAENRKRVEQARAQAKGDVAQPLEVYRAAERAMERIVRDAGAPGAPAGQAEAVEKALLALLGDEALPVPSRRAILWMISEIGNEASVQAVAPLLGHAELWQEAASALERIPVPAAVTALQAALDKADGTVALAIAASLRKRGQAVSEEKYPDTRLRPVKALDS